MRKLIVFNQVTLDGYFTSPTGDISWAHTSGDDPEWNLFTSQNAQGGGMLLFGRTTYELMKSYWPTSDAMAQQPVVAERMNKMPKLVFSRTLRKADWENTIVVHAVLTDEVRKLKQQSGGQITVLGSGTIVAQLARENLVDEYQLVIVPIAIGAGRTLFDGLDKQVHLRLLGSRQFKNGRVLLRHAPA